MQQTDLDIKNDSKVLIFPDEDKENTKEVNQNNSLNIKEKIKEEDENKDQNQSNSDEEVISISSKNDNKNKENVDNSNTKKVVKYIKNENEHYLIQQLDKNSFNLDIILDGKRLKFGGICDVGKAEAIKNYLYASKDFYLSLKNEDKTYWLNSLSELIEEIYY